MKTVRITVSRSFRITPVLLMGLLLVACGRAGEEPPPTGEFWNDIRETYTHIGMLEGGDREQFRTAAAELDRILQQHPEIPSNLERVLRSMHENAEVLANSRLSHDEYMDLSEQLAVTWSDLNEGFVPPQYRG